MLCYLSHNTYDDDYNNAHDDVDDYDVDGYNNDDYDDDDNDNGGDPDYDRDDYHDDDHDDKDNGTKTPTVLMMLSMMNMMNIGRPSTNAHWVQSSQNLVFPHKTSCIYITYHCQSEKRSENS